MASQMPELGSKISLISKADIRYEGQLFTVDPNECTIALANVRSFGTENRETQYPVPAQNQVYDYILFRGSDIKDIRVMSQLPNDPAIVQLVPPSMSQQPGYQSQAFNHPIGPSLASSLSQYPGYGGMGGMQRAPGPVMMQPSELGAVPTAETTMPIGPLSHDKEQDLFERGSRSTTPSITRKSPTNDQGTQVNNSPSRDDHKRPRPIQPPQRERREQPLYQPGQGFQRDNRRDYHQHQNREPFMHQQHQQRRGNNRQQRDDQPMQRPGPGGPQGGWVQRGNNNRQRGMRARGPPKQFNRQGGPPGMMKKSTLKFDVDYDFDKANTEFEELRGKLAKTKISGEEPVETKVEAKVNGEAEKKDDSGNETATGENEQEEECVPECYNKAKSFFDTISCEAMERSKGRSQRTDWRTERKLNSETFGVASARRGAYRGRGYYGGRQGYRPQMGGYRPRGPPRDHNMGQEEKPSMAAVVASETK